MRVKDSLAAFVLIGAITTPAAAQTVDVRVKVDTQTIREVTREVSQELRDAMREVFGPDVRRDIAIASREVAEVIGNLSRTAWTSGSQRNFPASQTDKETRTFAIGANGEFTLENLSGDIRVVPGSGRDLSVEITRHSRGRTDADAKAGLSRVRIETTHRGDRATARTVYPQNERQPNYSVTVDYVVTAPAGTRVTAKTMSGDVTVGAMTGDLTVNTMSGDVNVTGATRVTLAKTVSGDVILNNCSAADVLEASTMSGDVTGINIKARRVELHSISGTVTGRNVNAQSAKLNSMSDDVVFDGDLTAGGRYEFTTHSGAVRVAVDGRTGFHLEASTFSGTVRADLPVKLESTGGVGRRANRSMIGTFGDGSATIIATSFSGSVLVTKR